MTDLTEYTWYYCKMKNGDIQMLERGSDYFLSGDVPLLNNEVKQVLAPVPSYSEYLALQSDSLAKNEAVEINAELEAENAKLKEEYEAECHRSDELEDSFWKEHKENAQLKELLKECRNILNEQTFHRNTSLETDETFRNRIIKKAEILHKIDEVLK